MSLKQLEINNLKNHIEKRCLTESIDKSVIDFDATLDKELSYSENKEVFDQLLDNFVIKKPVINIKDHYKMVMLQKLEEAKEGLEQERKPTQEADINLDDYNIIAIIGDMHSAKTNLGFYMLRQYKGQRDVFLFGYPKKIDNFKMINTFHDLYKLNNAIVFCDELNKFITTYTKNTSTQLLDILSVCKHNNITLIFTACSSHFITRAIEGFIDCWCITRISDIEELKKGSKPKRILQGFKHHKNTMFGLLLNNGEYILFSEISSLGKNGVYSFEDQGIGKDWSSAQRSAQQSTHPIPQLFPQRLAHQSEIELKNLEDY